jgi:hypothetical protein
VFRYGVPNGHSRAAGWRAELAVDSGKRPPAPITVPQYDLPDLDVEAIQAETREAQARVRVIRAGRDAWEQIAKSGSFSGWVAIGRALAVGRDFALRATGANAPMGRRYCAEFSQWVEAHGFAGMQKSLRSTAIELAENIEAVEAWRATLPERQRKRLVHPLSNVRRWRASAAHSNGRSPTDLRRDAKAAWARFCASVRALPADEAMPLWQAAQAELASLSP